MASWKVRPDAVLGHSSGEIAAAYACGALCAQEAITVAYNRGLVLEDAHPGSMLTVNLSGFSREILDAVLEYNIDIAFFNSPRKVTVAGTSNAIEAYSARLSERGVTHKALPVTRAYHTNAMMDAAAAYQNMLDGVIHPKKTRIPMYSSLLGRRVEGTELTEEYWSDHMMKPVLFLQAARQALNSERNCDVFVEVGPHRLLSRSVVEIQSETGESHVRPCLSTMIRYTNTAENMMKLAGDLVLNGANLDLQEVNGGRSGPADEAISRDLLNRLPSYSWDYSSKSWIESRPSREWRFRKEPRHELLGSRVLEAIQYELYLRHLLVTGSSRTYVSI